MDNCRSKSLARSKKTFFTIAQALGKEGIGALVPGGGLVFAAVAALVNHGKEFFRDRTEHRLHEFHEQLLGSTSESVDLGAFLEKPISLDDYYALLSAALQDNEELKVPLYATLLRSFVEERIPAQFRTHFLRVARELTFQELELLRKIYIYAKYDLIPLSGPSEQISSLLQGRSTMQQVMKQNLERFGLLSRGTKAELKPSDVLFTLAEALFSKEELEPASIDKLEWTGIGFLITSFPLDDHTDIALRLEDLLRRNRIKSMIATVNERNVKQMKMFYDGILLLLDTRPVPEENRRALIQLGKPIFKVLISVAGSLPQDPLPDVEAVDTIILSGNWSADVKLIDHLIKVKILS